MPVDQSGDCFGGGAVGLGFDVGVVGGHGLIGVAEGLAADLGVHFGVAGEGGAGVAAAFVELDDRDACGFGECAEPAVDVVSSMRPAGTAPLTIRLSASAKSAPSRPSMHGCAASSKRPESP